MKNPSRSLVWIEWIAITAISAALAIAIWGYEWLSATAFTQERALPVIIGLSSLYASLLGFIIAIVIFLLGLVETKNFKALRASRSYAELWAIFKGAMLACATTSAIGVAAVFLIWFDQLPSVMVWLFASSSAWLFFRIGRIVWVLHLIIEAEIAQGERSRKKLIGS